MRMDQSHLDYPLLPGLDSPPAVHHVAQGDSVRNGRAARDEAYRDFVPRAGSQAAKVLDALRAAKAAGLTREQIGDVTGLKTSSVCGRVAQLVEAHLAVTTPFRRASRDGAQVSVVVAKEFAMGLPKEAPTKPGASVNQPTNEPEDSDVGTYQMTEMEESNHTLDAGVQYLIGKRGRKPERVLCFEDETGTNWIQHCTPIGTAVMGSRPQLVSELPQDATVTRLDPMADFDEEF